MDSLACVGIDVGGTYIKGGVVRDDGTVLAEKNKKTNGNQGPDAVLESIVRLVQELISESEAPVQGVGVGVPGQIDVARGMVREAPNLPALRNIPVQQALGKRLDLPVRLDNDANVAALGEHAWGAGQGARDMLMVTLGTGVGGGLILRNELYHGAVGAAGEFGHTVIDHDGPLCGCGRRGCVEAFVGAAAIIRTVREQIAAGDISILSNINPDELTPKDVHQAALQHDAVARAALEKAGRYLGVGLGSVANLLNPERIVVGGGVAGAGDYILTPARKSLSEIAMKASAEAISIVPAALGNRAGWMGAARLASPL